MWKVSEMSNFCQQANLCNIKFPTWICSHISNNPRPQWATIGAKRWRSSSSAICLLIQFPYCTAVGDTISYLFHPPMNANAFPAISRLVHKIPGERSECQPKKKSMRFRMRNDDSSGLEVGLVAGPNKNTKTGAPNVSER